LKAETQKQRMADIIVGIGEAIWGASSWFCPHLCQGFSGEQSLAELFD